LHNSTSAYGTRRQILAPLIHREKCGVSALFVNVLGCKHQRVCCEKFRDDARKIGFAGL
jgi:hypothetical protein